MADMWTQLSKNRENMYRLLGRLYIKEVDADLLNALKAMKFPQNCGEEELEEGYRLMETCLRGMVAVDGSAGDASAAASFSVAGSTRAAVDSGGAKISVLDALAVDYARVFLSAGVAQGMAAFPYESVYTSKKRLMMQDARGFAAAAYARAGLQPGKAMYHSPEDHIGLELEYMARLCAGAAIKEQQEFFKNHLQNWAYAFTAEVMKYARTDFYRAVSKITRGFMTMEQHLMEAQDADLAQQ